MGNQRESGWAGIPQGLDRLFAGLIGAIGGVGGLYLATTLEPSNILYPYRGILFWLALAAMAVAVGFVIWGFAILVIKAVASRRKKKRNNVPGWMKQPSNEGSKPAPPTSTSSPSGSSKGGSVGIGVRGNRNQVYGNLTYGFDQGEDIQGDDNISRDNVHVGPKRPKPKKPSGDQSVSSTEDSQPRLGE